MTNTTQDVVISTRVRLARNVSGYPFPLRLSSKKADEITSAVYRGVTAEGMYDIYKINDLTPASAEAMKESHLISKDLIGNAKMGSVALNPDRSVSIMIHEEDHVRAQCILPGFALSEAYARIDAVDDLISESVPYAYHDKLGYLTSCTTNLGTGMRASVMMFLPGLTITGRLTETINAVARLNMAIRGVYGEGSKADGYIYQISNQISLGYSEADILAAVQSAATHVVEAERVARAQLYEKRGAALKDEIMRSYGVALFAEMLTVDELFELTAMIKLGACYDFIKIQDIRALDTLLTDLQPANLTLKAREQFSDNNEKYAFRAKALRETLRRITDAQ